MQERAAAIFPFAIAVLMPPAGLLIGLFALRTERELGIRLMVVSALALVVWVLIFLSA